MTDQWAIVEMLGHRRMVGLVSEVELAGAGFLRVNVIDPDGGFKASAYIPPASIYCLTPTTEAAVRAEVERQKARPALTPYQYPVRDPFDPEDEDDEDDPDFEDIGEPFVPPEKADEL